TTTGTLERRTCSLKSEAVALIILAMKKDRKLTLRSAQESVKGTTPMLLFFCRFFPLYGQTDLFEKCQGFLFVVRSSHDGHRKAEYVLQILVGCFWENGVLLYADRIVTHGIDRCSR